MTRQNSGLVLRQNRPIAGGDCITEGMYADTLSAAVWFEKGCTDCWIEGNELRAGTCSASTAVRLEFLDLGGLPAFVVNNLIEAGSGGASIGLHIVCGNGCPLVVMHNNIFAGTGTSRSAGLFLEPNVAGTLAGGDFIANIIGVPESGSYGVVEFCDGRGTLRPANAPNNLFWNLSSPEESHNLVRREAMLGPNCGEDLYSTIDELLGTEYNSDGTSRTVSHYFDPNFQPGSHLLFDGESEVRDGAVATGELFPGKELLDHWGSPRADSRPDIGACEVGVGPPP